MAPPRHTSVDRAVDRDATPAQWAARDDKVLKAATRRWLRRNLRGRGGHSLRFQDDVVSRRIRRARSASESENHRCVNTNFFHAATSRIRSVATLCRAYIYRNDRIL